jgi:hypothetical protein
MARGSMATGGTMTGGTTTARDIRQIFAIPYVFLTLGGNLLWDNCFSSICVCDTQTQMRYGNAPFVTAQMWNAFFCVGWTQLFGAPKAYFVLYFTK